MSCFVNSPALKKILQLQVFSVITKFAKNMAIADLYRDTQLTLETIPVQRCSYDTDIVYTCAIALKLAAISQLQAIDIANQLVSALGENLYCPAQGIYLNFKVEVVSSGWIYFRLQDESLASYLQQLIFLEERKIVRWADGEMGGTRVGTDNFFLMQYAHARCCSLLRLAHRQDLIRLSDANCTNSSDSQFPIPQFPFPIPWLKEAQGSDGKVLQLRLVHPAERHLIAQIVDVQDALSNQSQLQGVKLARDLSKAFEKFYSNCRIWGKVKSQTLKLAQARLGLVAVTQILLRSLLQEHLGVLAPMEL